MTSATTTTTNSTQPFRGLPVVPPSDPSLTTEHAVPRKIAKSFLAREQAEGVGATVRRSIGTPALRNLTPFLMMDHFRSSPGAHFDDHPHRGLATIGMVFKGAIDHEDFAGNRGTIEEGGLQFMTAGRGIVHAEIPRHDDATGVYTEGMQLWVDLPKHLKSCEPWYKDLRKEDIPTVNVDDDKVHIKVISGQSHGVDSVRKLADTPVWLFDVTMQPGGSLTQPLPRRWNAFVYTVEGTATFGATPNARTVEKFHNVVFEQTGDSVEVAVDAGATEPARFLIVAGLPLDQKIVQYGPFVTTSQEEIYQAFSDFQQSENGFERALGWRSEIGKAFAARS